MTQERDEEDVINGGWNPHNDELWLSVNSSDFDGVPNDKFLWVKNETQGRVLGAVRKGEVDKDPKQFFNSKGFMLFQVATRFGEYQVSAEPNKVIEQPKQDEQIEGITTKTVFICSDGKEYSDLVDAKTHQEYLNLAKQKEKEREAFDGFTRDQLIDALIKFGYRA